MYKKNQAYYFLLLLIKHTSKLNAYIRLILIKKKINIGRTFSVFNAIAFAKLSSR